MSKFFKALIVFGFFIFPTCVFAHQPRLVSENTIEVLSPEVSKAYYAELSGVPHTYYISSEKEFNLYLSLLVPKSSNPEGRFSAALYDMGTDEELYFLDGDNFEWTEFFEPFGHDTYLEGPEYKTVMSAGSYRVAVLNQFNQGKYALAVGEIESFDFSEMINALKLIPILKKDFFNEVPAKFLFSPLGATEVAVIISATIMLMALLRFVLRKVFKKYPGWFIKNLSVRARAWRVFGFVLTFIVGAFFWSILLFIVSGVLLYQIISGWCLAVPLYYHYFGNRK
jgi:hypothetical protein